MRHFSAGMGVLLLFVAACSDDGTVSTGQSGVRDGGSGGASGSAGASGAGGAPGTQCTTNAQCPQLGCYMCPASVCVNGRCVTSGPIGTGTGGGAAVLKWYTTCGPPVCGAPQGSGGSSSGVPPCTTEKAGDPCTSAGTQCDTGVDCSGPLMCAGSDPTNGGACPKSRARFKTDIEYLGAEERTKLAEDVQSIPLVRYRYKDGPEREHLGFIIEDVEPSPGVDSEHDRVDLYGYASMLVAAVQEQQREIEALRLEVKELRGAAPSPKAQKPPAPRSTPALRRTAAP